MTRTLVLRMIVNLLQYVEDLEGLLSVVQQYAAEGLNRKVD